MSDPWGGELSPGSASQSQPSSAMTPNEVVARAVEAAPFFER